MDSSRLVRYALIAMLAIVGQYASRFALAADATGAPDPTTIRDGILRNRAIGSLPPDAARLIADIETAKGTIKFEERNGQPSVTSVTIMATFQTLTEQQLSKLCQVSTLEHLTLHTLKIDNATLKALAKCVQLKSLAIICPKGKVTDDGLASLAALVNLEELDLFNTPIRGEGLRVARELPKLAKVSLAGTLVNEVSDRAAVELSKCRYITSVELQGRNLTNNALAALATMTKLQHLMLTAPRVTSAGIEKLQALTDLRSLNLQQTPVRDNDLKALAKLTSLTDLNLAGTKVTDQGIETLKEFPALVSLRLDLTFVSNKTADELEHFVALRHLGLVFTRVTAERYEALKKARPDCQIDFAIATKKGVIVPPGMQPGNPLAPIKGPPLSKADAADLEPFSH